MARRWGHRDTIRRIINADKDYVYYYVNRDYDDSHQRLIRLAGRNVLRSGSGSSSSPSSLGPLFIAARDSNFNREADTDTQISL